MSLNLPFGVRVATDLPLDADRYIATDISARDSLITNGRAYVGLQVFVESEDVLYILKSGNVWEVIAIGGVTSATNGVVIDNGEIKLGGSITEPTTILASNNTLSFGDASDRFPALQLNISDVFNTSLIGSNPVNDIKINSTNSGNSTFSISAGSNVDTPEYLIGSGKIYLKSLEGSLNGNFAYLDLDEGNSSTSLGIEDSTNKKTRLLFSSDGVNVDDERLGKGLNYNDRTIDEANSTWNDDNHIPSVGLIKENITNQDSTTTEDVTSLGVPQVGAISPGDTIPAGTTFTDALKQILIQTVPPTYTQPTGSVNSNPNSIQEVGSTINYTITPSFNQNDAGLLNGVVIEVDGALVSDSANDNPVNYSTIVTLTSKQVTSEISYDDGPIKNDNQGNPDPTGRILAGSIINTILLRGSYYNWFGSSSSQPSTSSDIRTLSNSFSNNFTLNTGNTNSIMVIAIPDTKNLVSVIDEDALNADITSNYILSNTLTQVEDGGNNLVNYKVYVLTLAIPYASNHRHKITIT